MYFSVLLTACSLGYCCNLEALLSWYKYLLFRNIYTTAGCALLGSRNGLLILLQQQPFSFRWSDSVLLTLSTFVMVQVSSLQECLHHSGLCSSRISWRLARLATAATILISVEFLGPIDAQHSCHGTSILSSGLLSPQRNDVFLGSLVGLLALLHLSGVSSHMSSLSTLVLIQVSSLQEHLHDNG
jgi:hypothetical protein